MQLLLNENCHRHDRAFALARSCRRCTRQADLVFAAVSRKEMVRDRLGEPGATVIDAGINRIAGREAARTSWSATSPMTKPLKRGRRNHAASAGRRRADDDCVPARRTH